MTICIAVFAESVFVVFASSWTGIGIHSSCTSYAPTHTVAFQDKLPATVEACFQDITTGCNFIMGIVLIVDVVFVTCLVSISIKKSNKHITFAVKFYIREYRLRIYVYQTCRNLTRPRVPLRRLMICRGGFTEE